MINFIPFGLAILGRNVKSPNVEGPNEKSPTFKKAQEHKTI